MFFNNPNLKSGTDQQDTQKKMKEEPAVEKVEAKEETKADEKPTPVKEETVKEETVNKSEVAINEESGTSPITTDGEKDDTPKPEPSEETTTTTAAGEIKLSTELDDEAPKTFPQILMEILAKEEDSDTIAWLPHGRSFIIYKKKSFGTNVLPKYFKATKFTSFTRKLNRWGFTRVTRGPEMGSYYHKFFIRDEPDLCLRMSSHSSSKFQEQQQLMPNPMAGGMPFGMFPMPGMMQGMMNVNMANMNPADINQQNQLITQQLQQLQWQQFQLQQLQQQHQQAGMGGHHHHHHPPPPPPHQPHHPQVHPPHQLHQQGLPPMHHPPPPPPPPHHQVPPSHEPPPPGGSFGTVLGPGDPVDQNSAAPAGMDKDVRL